jgi:DNA polymerase-4
VADWILHVDMDQFVAAVEIRRRPELRGLPVVVGGNGDPTEARKVVSTASYDARAFGVRSGMPLRAALRRCPDAVFLATDGPAYDAASAEVMTVLREFPATVEVWGWDEAYLGVSTDDPEEFAEQVRAAVLARTGLSCAVGIGQTKPQAKLAAQSAKPGGIGRLTYENWPEVMHPKPVDALVGVGKRTAARLAEHAITTVGELALADPHELAGIFGPTTGPWLVLLARGGGDRTVSAEPWEARSRSRETTFAVDLTAPEEIGAALDRLSAQVARDAAADGRDVVRVGVKLRSASFLTRTKAMKVAPTRDTAEIVAAARTVLARFEVDRPVRLLGVRAEYAPPL